MASDVQIANMALSHMGGDARITSLNPLDGTIEADYAAIYMPTARRLLLSTYEWAFATHRVSLAQLAANPSDRWSYAYGLPAQALKVWRVIGGNSRDDRDGADFEREGNRIMTNVHPADAMYTKDELNYSVYPPGFVSALTFLLASYFAGPLIRGSEGARTGQALRQRAMEEAINAVQVDANASGDKPEWEGEIIPSSIQARA